MKEVWVLTDEHNGVGVFSNRKDGESYGEKNYGTKVVKGGYTVFLDEDNEVVATLRNCPVR